MRIQSILDAAKREPENSGYLCSMRDELKRNVDRFNSPDVQEFMNYFVAALMIEYHKAYPNYSVQAPYRIKSPASTFIKIRKFFKDKTKYSVAKIDGRTRVELLEEIPDMFGIKMILHNSPELFSSKNENIMSLIREKNRNQAMLGKLQEFGTKISSSEFPGLHGRAYNYDCSRAEYYFKCMLAIMSIKTMIHPDAVELKAKYDKKLQIIKQRIPTAYYNIAYNAINSYNVRSEKVENDYEQSYNKRLRSFFETMQKVEDKLFDEEDSLKEPITEEDTKAISFFKLMDDFSSRLTDKLDLAVLTEQVRSIFHSSELLKQFGVTLLGGDLKRKRTENGYVSNFLFLDTPFGKIELQLITEHEEREANYGYSAHRTMQGKSYDLVRLPNIDDENSMKNFKEQVDFVSPKKYIAQFDNLEKNRVLIQVLGDYQNYKSIMSQVPEGSPEEIRIAKYFYQLYKYKNVYFPNNDGDGRIESYTESDIEEYFKTLIYKQVLEGRRKKFEADFSNLFSKNMSPEMLDVKTISEDDGR